jgi:hypothetical protein
LHENTDDILFTVGKLSVLLLVSYPQNAEKQRRGKWRRRGMQTDMATEGRLHFVINLLSYILWYTATKPMINRKL